MTAGIPRDTSPRHRDPEGHGRATYQSKEGPRGKGPGTSDGMPQRSISGTGPNPNLTFESGGGTYDVYASQHTGGQGDSGGFSQDDNDLQCLSCPQPRATQVG